MNVFERARTSLRLRLGRGWVQVRRRLSRRKAAPAPPSPERDRIPIVLVGCHRSGTSLLRRIVDSHSRIACPPETLFLEPLGAALSHDLAEKGFAAIGLTVEEAAADVGEVVDRWMRRYAASKGKPRWAEKSPATFHQLPAVDRMLRGQARFVLVHRDGMDVAHSLGKGRWSVLGRLLEEQEDPYVAAAHYWVDANRKLRAFREATPDRAHRIRYEDLVDDPERELRALFAFLDEPWEPEVLRFNDFPHDGGVEDHVVTSTWKIEDNRGKHRELPAEQQARMWAVVREEMLATGYPDRPGR